MNLPTFNFFNITSYIIYIYFNLGPDMVPDLVVLSNGSSDSESEHENEEQEEENKKIKIEENSLTPPLDQVEGERSEESGQDSGDDTDSSGSTSSSSKSSQSSGICN